jgi:hypothetical protein
MSSFRVHRDQNLDNLSVVSINKAGSIVTDSLETPTVEHKMRIAIWWNLPNSNNSSPYPGSTQVITLKYKVIGDEITVDIPAINLQVQDDVFNSFTSYASTVDGFLPESIRPFTLTQVGTVSGSKNATSIPFNTQTPPPTPVSTSAYNVQIGQSGALYITSACGQIGNNLAAGPHMVNQCTIVYNRKEIERLSYNITLSDGQSDVTTMTGSAAADGYRDSHMNDFYNRKAVWAWTDNSNVPDALKSTGIMETMVRTAQVALDGTLTLGPIVQLTNHYQEYIATGYRAQSWNTSVAINRTNDNNIVVSYGKISRKTGFPTLVLPWRAYTTNGGATMADWTVGILNTLPTGTPARFGDCTGVQTDKYGNMFYMFTNINNASGVAVGVPTVKLSVDGGNTYSTIWTAPDPLDVTPATHDQYDYPQLTFGGDGFGNYGMWVHTLYFVNPNNTLYFVPYVTFIIINGFNSIGAVTEQLLWGLGNQQHLCCPAASADGRYWSMQSPYQLSPTINSIAYKSPGAIDVNWAGPWTNATIRFCNQPADTISFPVFGYLNTTVRGLIYDEDRQALYALIQNNKQDIGSQDTCIYFMVSRDCGSSWSDPIKITTTDVANRGYQSMALDPVSKGIVIGFYDGRKDPTFIRMEYMAASISAAKLQEMVDAIELTPQTYSAASVGGLPQPMFAMMVDVVDQPRNAMILLRPKNHDD